MKHFRRGRRGALVPMLGVAALLVYASIAAAGVVTVENRSARTIKAVAPGGSAVVEPGAEPVRIVFPDSEDVGATLQVWWTAMPRQLCRIFVPWARTAVITGDQAINCLSHTTEAWLSLLRRRAAAGPAVRVRRFRHPRTAASG